MLSSLSLRSKLFLLAFLGIAGTSVVGTIGYVTLGSSIAAAEGLALAGKTQRSQMDGEAMHDAIRTDVYSAMLAAQTADDKRGQRAAQDLSAHAQILRASMKAAGASGLALEVSQAVDSLLPHVEKYVTRAQAVQVNAAGDPIALAQAIVSFEDSFRKVDGKMDSLGTMIEGRATAISEASAKKFAMAKTIVFIAAVLVVALALLFGFFIERGITSNVLAVVERVGTLRDSCISELRAALTALTRGDLDVVVGARAQVLPVTSKDEIGTLTQSVNDIITQTHATVESFEEARAILRHLIVETNRLADAARDGRLQERGDEGAFDGSFRELVQGINHTLDAVVAPVNAATVALERLAQRDLTARVTGEYKGDHARIAQSLNSALDNLSEALAAVASTAEGVAIGARQIDGGSKDLAHGASDQAASLEEVSASARELAAMTKRNAASAAEGRSLADGARQATSEGVGEARRLAEAIARIKASSEATAKIVKTIDEIAFQTNLLALNAAVEAARAGDSGRGFAVVADEVRSLAMRSADAARNTAQLIDESVKSTEQGVSLNAKVLTQLGEIDDRVNRVGQVVGEIAAASDEQARGVELIDRALDEMSHRTQAVAASADESEGASRNLLEQSDALRALVGEFKLEGGATHTVVPRVPLGGGRRGEPSHGPAARPVPSARLGVPSVRSTNAPAPQARAKGAPTAPGAPAPRAAAPRRGAPAAPPSNDPDISIPLDDDDWNSMQSF
jgi:methyl-accepting chemotaxis protein